MKVFTLAISILTLSGCLASTDFRAPEHRLIDLGADVLPDGTTQLGFGLLGSGYDNLGLSAIFKRGMPANTELGTNLAHDLLGIINLDLRMKFVDQEWGRIGARIGFKWFNPQEILLFQLMDKKPFGERGEINLFMLPITLQSTFPLADWADLHINLGYLFQGIQGTVSNDFSDVHGGVGAREVFLQPHLSFYAWDMAFIVGAQLPIWAQGLVSARAETEIQDGVILGVQSTEYQELEVKQLTTTYVGAEWRWGSAHVRFMMTYGLRFLTGRIKAPLPSLDVYWRF
ncbi:MAG TPA: hypothetical protein EYN06_10725 [Myxococcales bacterium]|nr:hypothetical protein [Myxococcales bacterium]HIN86947.1 hypothetical protein [Myxococcales bacterium]